MFIQGEKGGLKFIRTDRELSRGLIGSTWHRREKEGDPYDNVVIEGFIQAFENLELVYRPVDFGEALQADVTSFNSVYARDDPVVEAADNALRSLLSEVERLKVLSDAS
jgi:hypothetical protein